MSNWSSEPDWNHVQHAPLLTRGNVHFWRVDVETTHSIHSSTWLEPDERAKADRYYRFADRARFSAGRTALRLLLAGYLRSSPRALRFEAGSHGKPFLPDAPGLSFNLSHSGGWVVIGVATGAAVGVDVESIVAGANAASLAGIGLSARERQWVETASPEAPQTAFYRAWTRKEAYLKMLGSGLVDNLSDLDCRLEGPHLMEAARLDAHQKHIELHHVSLHEASPGEGYVAALVTDEPGCTVRRLTFDSGRFSASRNRTNCTLSTK
jgi:4'-phosphopantetheinyl transferase